MALGKKRFFPGKFPEIGSVFEGERWVGIGNAHEMNDMKVEIIV